MLQVKKGTVQGYQDMKIPFTLLSHNQHSRNLAVIFPGAGYTVQAPLLHYTTGIFLNKSFDVLHVNYQYNQAFYDEFSSEELTAAIQYDVKTAIDLVLKDSSYEYFYLIGKSLGTIALSSELQRDIFKKAKAVWLTPLLQKDVVFDAMLTSENKGLCFIGDNDRCYIEDRFNQVAKNPNIVSNLIPNVNHGLEFNHNVIESIGVLKSVLKGIEQL